MTTIAERPATQEGVHIPGLDLVLPMELDLTRDSGREVVINVVRKLAEKYTAAYKGLEGIFLVGSIAHGESHNGSDVDLIYVMKTPRTKMDQGKLEEGIVDFLADIDEVLDCYGMEPASDGIFAIDLRELEREYRRSIEEARDYTGGFQLDKYSLLFGADKETEGLLEKMLDYKDAEPKLFFPKTGRQPDYELCINYRKLACSIKPRKLDTNKAKTLKDVLAVNYLVTPSSIFTGIPVWSLTQTRP